MEACTYLDSIDNFEVLQDSIQGSLAMAIANRMIDGSPEERNTLSQVEGMQRVAEEAIDLLPQYCYPVRRLIIEEKTRLWYQLSEHDQANAHFKKGNAYLQSGDYDLAIKEYKKATKIDDEFVYALDHLAIAHRRKGDLKTALKYYKKSLELFPEGEISLLNTAVCYLLLEDLDQALDYYGQMQYYYPQNPEGYFGLAKIQFIKKDYEPALDNLFIAHRMYVETGSDYVSDSEQLLSIFYQSLQEMDKLDLFHQKAKEHHIDIGK